jgi:hypothetical protein
MQEIAFADDANEFALIVNDWNGADPLLQEQLGNFLNAGGGLHGNHRGNHQIARLHGEASISSGYRVAPFGLGTLISVNGADRCTAHMKISFGSACQRPSTRHRAADPGHGFDAV